VIAITYPNAVETPTLEAKLPTQVKVFCTQNTGYSFAVLADHEVYLDLNTCSALLRRPSAVSFATAADTLYHEWWHVAFQETNEKFTECGAYAVLRYVLRRYWGLTKRAAQKAYEQAWGWSPYAPLPCLEDAA
jgi:hypothetical protein